MLSAATAQGTEWVTHAQDGTIELFAEYRLAPAAVFQEVQAVGMELQQLLQLPATKQQVQLIIFSSAESYRNFLRNRIPQAVHRRAIFYRNDDVSQIYAYRHRALMEDLRHEYTHALLHQVLPWIPLWIDEGMSEFMEIRPENRNRSSRLTAMKWRCRSGWQPSLRELEQIPSAAEMTSADYRNSWAWIHFLMNESSETRGLLSQYLQAVSAGEAPGMFSNWATERDAAITNRVGSYFRRFKVTLR